MSLTMELASRCCDFWFSPLPSKAVPSSFFPSIPSKSRNSETRSFWFPDSAIDIQPLSHCCSVRQFHRSISLYFIQVITIFLDLGSFAYKMQRANSQLVLAEHLANRDKEEMDHIIYSSSPSETSSVYSSDDSANAIFEIHDRYFRGTQPYPNPVSISARIQPDNFGIITPKLVFRSSYPFEDNFKYLEVLELRTIITLVDEPIPVAYRTWMKRNGIKHITALVTPNKEHKRKRTDVQQIAHVLGLMMDPKNQPLLVHCNKGKHRSGCVAAAFRKCSGQPIQSIIDEYVQFAGDKARALDIAFINAFDERAFRYGLHADSGFRADSVMGTAIPLTGSVPAETLPVIDPLASSPVVTKTAV
ncbi:hypothetical protein NA57DRAFT_74142 [Rhizodiscina lignyota]|uniref:Tyrosine phosphatase n=1 Tax=Rhizodiscina lignyota TaxID=1504668 RepID=A0A9P4IF02_9PEZI|nr:hypothetical protein NA57DRAFT_74142 [Rhizodiscina lignyota]